MSDFEGNTGNLIMYEPEQFFDNQILTVRDASRLLKLSTKTIYKMVALHELPHKRARGEIRFLLPELMAWMKGG